MVFPTNKLLADKLHIVHTTNTHIILACVMSPMNAHQQQPHGTTARFRRKFWMDSELPPRCTARPKRRWFLHQGFGPGNGWRPMIR